MPQLEEMIVPMKPPRLYQNNYGTIFTYYLSGPIGRPEDYVNEIEAIRRAGPNDVVQIFINSPGGDLMTGLQLREAIQSTSAHVQCVVEGQCASAATMVFLAGHELVSNEWAVFMFHNYSGGTVGKGGEMHEQITFERKWSTELMSAIYKDFLTKAEIQSMMDGKDFWMTGKDVMTRIQSAVEKRQKQAEKRVRKKPAQVTDSKSEEK